MGIAVIVFNINPLSGHYLFLHLSYFTFIVSSP